MASLNYINHLPQCNISFFTRKCNPNPNPKPNRIITCSSRPKISPWLMLPPSLNNGTNLVYDFYSLGKDKVVSFNKKREEYDSDSDLPHEKAEFVGSSHGWIISFENCSENSNLFLTNPLTATNKKLPSPYHLPLPYSHIENVVLSSPDPNDYNCRAVMRYDLGKLAFCCPAFSIKWTPFGNKDGYCSSVFSARQKLFFCLTKYSNIGIEAWDLSNLNSPVMIPMKGLDEHNFSELWWRWMSYLAVDDESDDLYLVRRSIPRDCLYGTNFGQSNYAKHFNVYKYDNKASEWKYMDGSLDGMAIFIGMNHGFALRAADYPNLKNDTVYFTDIEDFHAYNVMGHDMGIFDYRNRTLSHYYPYEYGSWFTPHIDSDSDYENYLINSSL